MITVNTISLINGLNTLISHLCALFRKGGETIIDITLGTRDGPIVGKLTLNTETGYFIAVMDLAKSGMKDVAKDADGHLALEGLHGYERVVEFKTVNNAGHVQFEGYVIPGEYTGALCCIEGL